VCIWNQQLSRVALSEHEDTSLTGQNTKKEKTVKEGEEVKENEIM
jgi:hypothetical protein